MTTTVRVIAKAAGVSHTTVSRVFNGQCRNWTSCLQSDRLLEQSIPRTPPHRSE